MMRSRKQKSTGSGGRTDRRRKTERLAYSALFAALAMILTAVDSMIPYNVGAPGVKLGLANLVILLVLYKMDLKSAAWINLIRILAVGFAFTGVMAMAYSLTGGFLSLLIMWALKKTGRFSMIGVSMAGGVSHNLGQMAVAALTVGTGKIFLYFPILVYTGIAAGICMGIVAWIVSAKIPDRLFTISEN